jgi:hypothetical protein
VPRKFLRLAFQQLVHPHSIPGWIEQVPRSIQLFGDSGTNSVVNRKVRAIRLPFFIFWTNTMTGTHRGAPATGIEPGQATRTVGTRCAESASSASKTTGLETETMWPGVGNTLRQLTSGDVAFVFLPASRCSRDSSVGAIFIRAATLTRVPPHTYSS